MKKGDKVRFLSESGGGIVAGFQGKDIVLVEDEDGFQIPTRINDVVVIDSDNYNLEKVAQKRVGVTPKNPDNSKSSVSQSSVPNKAEQKISTQKVEKPVLRPMVEERKGGDKLSASFPSISAKSPRRVSRPISSTTATTISITAIWWRKGTPGR